MDLSPDTMLHNRYRLIRQLGQGGMGAVYLALDTALDHEVALKVNRNTTPHSTSQFLREARLLATLRHPNLPRVIDYFVVGEEQFLVMDYIPGDDLGALLAREGAQPPQQVLAWARQLSSALGYLHSQEPPIIHRDIKPANIKLTPEGQVMLVDFGIAKTVDTSQATQTGALGYTPGFAPPEQYGSGRTGPHTDQYALAATLYTLLTGQKPADAVQRALGQENLLPLHSLVRGLPAHVPAVLEKALSLRPEDRFASVDLFEAALEDSTQLSAAAMDATVVAGHNRPVASLPPVPPAPPAAAAGSRGGISRWVWVLVGGALLLMLVSAAALLGGLWLWNRQTGTPSAAAAATLPPAALAPSQTAQPAATDTPQPSATLPPPTDTPAPTETTQPSPTVTQPPLGAGGLVAFSSDRADGKTLQIWTMRVTYQSDGQITASDFQQVTLDEGDKTQPEWSPDGKRLLYVAPGGKDEKGANLGLDIWMINADGSGLVDLTRRKGDDTAPAWSPDGTTIAFTNNGRSDGVRQINTISPTGKDLRRISYDLEEYDPTWSPDMKWLGFVGYVNSNYIFYLRARTAQTEMNLATQTPAPFDIQTIFTNLGQVADPAWSPDGQWVAYTRMEGASGRRIQLARVISRGGKVVPLEGSQRDLQPAWSPDANWLVFTSERDGNPEVYVMNLSGQLQTNLTRSAGRDLYPAWQRLPQP